MKIKELLERDPTRGLETVVKVDQRDPAFIRTELNEYVMTREIRDYFSDIIDRFIESRTGIPPSVNSWISGFFGSGKSHFLKLIGYVLANLPVKLEGGEETGAASFFMRKHSLSGAPVLSRELKTTPIFVNLLDRDIAAKPSISRIIYFALSSELGLSEVPWIAEVERSLQKMGLWDGFLDFVKEETGAPWHEVRKMQVRARPMLARGLSELNPKEYPNIEIAERSLDDVESATSISPGFIAQRLNEEATKLDPNDGRVVVLLDEVGLYIGTNEDRLTELNALSEKITEIGRGKLWLFVTAQEALEEIIPKVTAEIAKFQWLRDRFRIRVSLTPENIDEVVKKRWLAKSPDPAKIKLLRDLYHAHSGELATAVMIKNPARDYRGLFTQLDEDEFIASYPLMPYHVRLMQEIFGALRAKGGISKEVTGRERAVLAVVRSLFTGTDGPHGLADAEVGKIATLDMIYNSIAEELKDIQSAEQATIEDEIERLGTRDGLKVSSVAKAVFLLQQVGEWLPVTVENIAAVLYSKIGMNKANLDKAIKEALVELIKGKWVAEKEGKYKFLTAVERTFEQDVAAQRIDEPERRELAFKVAQKALRDFKSFTYKSLRPLNVYFTVDDQEVTSKGHLKLAAYTPFRTARNGELVSSLLRTSIANRDTIYWLPAEGKEFEEKLDRIIAVKKALTQHEFRAQSDEERNLLVSYRRNNEVLVEDDLPRILVNSLTRGKIIYQGTEEALDGAKPLKEIFNLQMRELASELFTEFDLAAFRIERDEDIGKILGWRGGPLPAIYKDLQLVDERGNILTDRPVADRVLKEIERRQRTGEELTGGTLDDHFEAPPYGWDPRIVRLTLAALFQNGSITVTLDGKEYISSAEPGSHEAFTKMHPFNRARFAPGVEVSPADRKTASKLISEIFGEVGGQTIEEVNAAILRAVDTRLDNVKRLLAIAQTIDLPVQDELASLEKTLSEIEEFTAMNRRILGFIDDGRIAVLKETVPLFSRLLEFDRKGNLDEYRRIRIFGAQYAPDLISVGIDEQTKGSIESLNNKLAAEDFVDRWPDIVGDDEKLRSTYVATYKRLHAERNRQLEDALLRLRKHPTFEKLPEKGWDESLRPLTRLVTPHELSLGADGFICEICTDSLADLNYHIQLIGPKYREIRIRLDEELSKAAEPGKEYLTGHRESREVSSLKDLDGMVNKAKEAADRAFSGGKKIRASIEIEVIHE